MASISSSVGLASGLEIESLVSQLMAVEKRPVNLLQSKQEIITTKLSSMGLVKSALSEFQAAAAALDSRSEFAAFSASVADTTIGSASASSAAKAGSYSLEVEQLATTQKVVSQAKASGVATGTADARPCSSVCTVATSGREAAITITTNTNSGSV